MGILHKERQAECPHLGLAANPSSRQPRASAEHRCYAGLSRERVDLDHQRRFCLASSYESCPFLTVNEAQIGPVERISAWWRIVSPAGPALTAAQLGQVAELGAAAAGGWLSKTALLTLEMWRIARPQREAPPLMMVDAAPAEPMGMRNSAPVLPLARRDSAQVLPMAMSDSAPGMPMAMHETPAHSVVADETPTPVGVDEEPSHVAMSQPPVRTTVSKRPLRVVGVDQEAPPTAAAPHATTANAWFLRAENAETLDDVIDCLKRAAAIEPDNQLIASSLQRAVERRDAQRNGPKVKPMPVAATSGPKRIGRRGRNPISFVLSAVGASLRLALSLAALILGGAWLLSAVPAAMRDPLVSASGLPTMWLPDTHGVTSMVHFPLGGGYDLGMAVPYAIGFLALFIGLGILRHEPSLGSRS